MDKVATRETREKKRYQLGGREGRVDRRRVVEVGAGSGAKSRSEGGTKEVESTTSLIHKTRFEPFHNCWRFRKNR